MSFGKTGAASVAVLLGVVVGCASETTDPPTGTGGSGGTSSGGTSTGGTSTGGTSSGGTSSGGTSTGGSTTGGSSTGGTSGASGAAPIGGGGAGGATTGGSSSGGTSGAGGGAGASASGGTAGAAGGIAGSVSGGASGRAGAGGMSGAAGTGGGTGGGAGKGASSSMGCGKSTGMPMNVNVPNAVVTFPDNYNGSTPVPLMFGFHGAGRTNQEFYTVDARMQNSDLENHFAMVYLKAAGDAWATSDKSRFDTAYMQMTQNYCIDLNRVFATGHSSGANFIEQLLCGGETRLKAVTPVAGSRSCASWAPIPSMLIHGLMDNQRANDGNGAQERGPFITSNACTMTTTPYTAAMACNSIYNQAAVNSGCVSYSGCTAPFVFCNHNDMNYSGTNHGWPCFANQAMYAFLSAI